jgi:2-polyprenyl-3-methyl-5-hydroxy-6-metoxy-1,4-benzoquinol methylase
MFAALRKLLTSWFGPPAETPARPLEPENAEILRATANMDEIHPETLETTPSHAVPYDENLLERARTQWQFGDWESLAKINRDTLQHHPDRAKLALLAAAGKLQTDNNNDAKQFIRLAQDWGINKKLISQILTAGVHNSLGRAAALGNQQQRALQHFESAITIGTPGSDAKLLTQARTGEQLSQLGIMEYEFYKKTKNSDFLNKKNPSTLFNKNEAENINLRGGYFSSARYWNDRYESGGNSGYGSHGDLAKFKAMIINDFIRSNNITKLLDFGCGDGNQAALFAVNEYIGVDVSQKAISKCRERLKNSSKASFYLAEECSTKYEISELVISLDVIFHLVEDDIFYNYMNKLFELSNKFVIIYASNSEWLDTKSEHVKGRAFTKWINANITGWELYSFRKNDHPYDREKNQKTSSYSDFFFYRKVLM